MLRKRRHLETFQRNRDKYEGNRGLLPLVLVPKHLPSTKKLPRDYIAGGSNRLPPFYIFVNSPAGAALSHGGNTKLIGKNMFNLKESEGKLFIQEIAKVAKQGGGWAEYKWTNPASKKIETKMTYVEPVGDLAVGCGFYK